MRVASLLALLPLTIAAPATKNAPRSNLPDLTALEWSSIQSGFVDRVWSGISDLSGWSLHQADDLVEAMRHSADSEDESKTIWKQLKGDEQFSKLVKAIEFADVKDIFDDDKITFTFFAPNNDALTPPKGHGHPDHHHDHDHHGHHHHESIFADLEKNPSLATVSSVLESNSFLANDDDDDHKKKREIFKKIVQKVLQYHSVMKHSLTAQELAQNSTVATVLKADDGSYGGLHRRIKVEKQLLPPSVNLNFYAKVISADHKASNGIFHVINHPLIPPPSLFDVSYQFPDFFSTLVSATYGSHGVHYLDYHYDREASKPGEPHFKGTGLATLFSPTNSAFGVLPPGLKFYLFSPFGERALVKVLAYHYVPHTLLLSELLYHEKDHHHHHDKKVEEVEYFTMEDDPSYHKEFEVETGLPNATLHIVVDKTKFLPVEGAVKTTIKVNGQTTLAVDAQARNGAFHPIGKLLVPPHHHHDENGVDVAHLDSWENWEEWLPAFAAAE